MTLVFSKINLSHRCDSKINQFAPLPIKMGDGEGGEEGEEYTINGRNERYHVCHDDHTYQ